MPLFEFGCPACGKRFDRLCGYEDRSGITCPSCDSAATYIFVPTRSKPIVYGNDSIHPAKFTGPRQRARYLNDHDLIELGDEPLDGVHKEFARIEHDAEVAREREIEKEVDACLTELGDTGLYQSVPAHVAAREDVSRETLGGPDGS